MNRIIADVIIVGAGIVGCSVALHLARRKGIRVLVVEKGPVGSGMTKRSGGLIRAHAARRAHPTEARLAVASWQFFQNWPEIVGGNCGFTKTGLIVVASEEQAPQLGTQVGQLQALGANTQFISRSELRDLQPSTRVEDIGLAAYEPDAGFVDPTLTPQSLAARAKEWGAKFKTGTMAKSIRVDFHRVIGVDTNIGLIEALNVVIAAGPWTDRLLKPLHAAIGIRTPRVQVAFFDRPTELRAGHTAFEDWNTGAHFRPHTFGLTMAGMNAPQAGEETNPDSFDESVSPMFVANVQQRLAARIPALAHARYIRGHAGVYDASPDGHAVLGRVPGIAGLFVAAGFSDIGFAIAPAVGACLSELIADGETRTADVSALGLARFNS